ncbi:UNVERIFIED_CONTAM: hypothetical protein GTU68_002608 [Idotea baltica]|nr:hypothetical protein [Idotea baltica]
MQVNAIEDPSRLADAIVVQLNIKLEDKQDILETFDPTKRLEKILSHMKSEIEILQVEKKIRGRVKRQMEKTQKEYYLNEQMRAIQKELGDKDDFKNEIQELEEKLKSKDMPDEAKTKTAKEIKKLKMMSPMSAEASVVRNYIDWMLGLPWNEKSEEEIDIDKAREVLDADHFGLEKVKERILEYLAVQKLVGKIKGPILCLVGPPGVGKTSLGKSIAKATQRKFVRVALGGVRDEAEIRGHRRTYIGALPGKMIQSLKKAENSNPVFLLDEIDKMSHDFRGDPSSALLEVLDPEQNATFNDHYLDCDYDLSDIMFITTANTLHTIPQPLMDRMEIISLSGYTEIEKLSIAKKYLYPKQLENNGLNESNLEVKDDAFTNLIRLYTKESGVRSLERVISTVCRKAAIEVVEKGKDHKLVLDVPEGGIPKDGPSAGITMALSLVSALTGIPVNNKVAMTGEITLRGNVLPIGGLKEKVLAAHRAGITKILLPKDNENDIEDIPKTVRKDLQFVPVSHVDQVIYEGLVCQGPKDFENLVDVRETINERFFAEEDKEKSSDDSKDVNNKSSEIVAH